MENKKDIERMIDNLHNVGEWIIEIVGGDPDDMESHIGYMLDELGETIHYLERQRDSVPSPNEGRDFDDHDSSLLYGTDNN